ncbi:Uncharacterised protein [Mycobacteroides abscessus]|nr:Uncharacterised protein [Mycobacteroides abscessus]
MGYPSPSNTWPKWLWQLAHSTSTRRIPSESSGRRITASELAGSKKDGQPQWDSNFSVLRNSSAPHARQLYTPSVLVSVYSPTNGRSVPARRSTANSSGVSRSRHCSSVRFTFGSFDVVIGC